MVSRRKGDPRAIAARLAEEMGFELVDAGMEKEPAGIYLRVYLDKEGGISLNDCEAFHRRYQPLVEELPYDYLEVCSPGADRPIKTARDAERALGKQVELRLYRPLEGKKLFVGALLGLDEEGYHIQVGQQARVFPAKQVALVKPFLDIDDTLAQGQEHREEEEP